MAGKEGFEHRCEANKVQKSAYKRSLKDSTFSHAQINMIWDFYVTHALSGGTDLERSIENYGWQKNDNKVNGYPAIEKALSENAGLDNNMCFIRAKTCKDTLDAMNLRNDRICIEHPRAVMLRNYTIQVDENEKMQFAGGQGSENNVMSLFRHIRNSLAHGNTYFFDNGYMLLEDKDGKTVTASILINQQTLLDWIRVIDKDEQYYILIDACASCKQEETNARTNI